MILIATGSEVELAMKSADELAKKNIPARVVSMPSSDIFDKQKQRFAERIAESRH